MTEPQFVQGEKVTFNHCGKIFSRVVREATPCGRKGLVKIHGYLLWLNRRRVLNWPRANT